MTRPLCGSCPACLERTARLLRSEAPRPCASWRIPSAAELERHGRRFGPEQVAETAAELGMAVKVDAPRVRRPRTKGPTLRQRVAAHLAEGRSVELIAELENLSPSRARRLADDTKEG